MINRRDFCSKAIALGVSLPFLSMAESKTWRFRTAGFQYVPLIPSDIAQSTLPIPDGHRVAFGYNYFSLPVGGEGLPLECGNIPAGFEGEAYLRLQVAIDTREEDEVEVYLGKSGRKVGQLSIWYPTGLQLFQSRLDCDPRLLREEGIRLQQSDGKNTMYFVSSLADNGSHLLLVDKNHKTEEKQWIRTLCSDRSLQPFGWTEGTGLDGLQELYVRGKDKRALKAVRSHLDKYLVDDKNLVYVDLWARPRDNTFTNLEAGLPFATIAQHQAHHPSVNLFIDFCKKRVDAGHKFLPDKLSTEGCYTLAYPLTQLGKALKKPELFELALIELEHRIKYLADDKAVYNIGSISKGTVAERQNWGRGFVWFLLGIVRSAEILQNESQFKGHSRIEKLKEAYRYYSKIALSHQRPDHSWGAYLDQPQTGFESSATAGLAAAFAHGHRIGWLSEFSKTDLNNVYQRLLKHVTPDGFLMDVTQHNAGSIDLLQKGTYRVIAQYSLGFMAHIETHL